MQNGSYSVVTLTEKHEYLPPKFSDFVEKMQSEGYLKDGVDPWQVEYGAISEPPPSNIFVMKNFGQEFDPIVERQFTPAQLLYRRDGILVLENFIPHDLIDRYLELRERLGMGLRQFKSMSPFVEHEEIRNLVCYPGLVNTLKELHQAEMGVIFALTGFTSTQRGWHADAYLDDRQSIPRLAVWVALGDIRENSGPFQFIRGSHRWPAMSNQKINTFLKEQYHWPKAHNSKEKGVPGWGRISESFVDPAVNRELDRRGKHPETFLAKKGDVLIWYGRTIHRGSMPAQIGTSRPSIIIHYAPIFEKNRGFFAKTADGAHYLLPKDKVEAFNS